MNVIPFPEYIPILEEYRKELSNKDDSTIDAYMRILRQFTEAHRRKRVDPEKSCTGIVIPPQPQMAPRMLSPDKRYVLKNLIERDGEERSAAIFALGYLAGCRPSDVSWLLVNNVYVGPKIGRIKVGRSGNWISGMRFGGNSSNT
ncbi:hypothetical protein [Paenibacillus larvae]|uniref:hypothetical protein n=2 Tax=Paenibacillus larvae TaxID=1464 RepID=UPI00122E5DEB|nr:hypothetical protein [Paenibacillus larvae]